MMAPTMELSSTLKMLPGILLCRLVEAIRAKPEDSEPNVASDRKGRQYEP